MRCPLPILVALLSLTPGVHADAPQASAPFVAYMDDTPFGAGIAADLRAALAEKMRTATVVPRIELVAVDLADKQVLREALTRVLRRRPAAIVAGNSNAAMVAQSLTQTVPVIFASHEDPVALGMAHSLARPGGNLTGFTYFVPVDAKRLELLRELAPHARKLGILIDRWWLAESGGRAVVQAARDQLGFEAELFQAESALELKQVLATPKAKSMEAWYVPAPGVLPYQQADVVVREIEAMRRPAMYPATRFVDLGGLVSYGQLLSRQEAVTLVATALALVLDGMPPGEIPIERPKAFELAINVTAARRLGIVIPDSMLKRADRVVAK
jgi:putative ABC transport system substrate-binding protein